MTRSKIMSVAMGAVLLTATAMPASAVSIRHTNRAEGDPTATSAPMGRAAPPETTGDAHLFDKAHESGGVR